jgi:acyl carrier protein
MMNDLQPRLIKCFAAVFPELTEAQIHEASSKTVEAWDSVASVTLVTLIEEEFAIEIGLEDLERFVSFDSVLEHLAKRNHRDS